jgi:excisionase family DNA binding protein
VFRQSRHRPFGGQGRHVNDPNANTTRISFMNLEENYNTSEFMSVPETARYLGMGRKMVYQLLDNGDLAFTRERGAIRILAESVVAFRGGERMA